VGSQGCDLGEITMLTHRHQKGRRFSVLLTDCQTDRDEFIQLWLHGKSHSYQGGISGHRRLLSSFTEKIDHCERVKIEDVAAFCEGDEKQGMRLV